MEAASFKVSPDSEQSLEVVEYKSHAGGPGNQATNLAGNSHLCLRVDDIQAVYESLTAQGVRFRSPPVAITSGPNQGGFVVYFYDPDGFTFELFQRPPQK
jgi:catechol 2,3-dioxygenase-like lactoylglutathione lyase family enzyme